MAEGRVGAAAPRGRPRSEAVHRALLSATIAELESRGYAGLTIEGVAARAGAGKQTIYRRWSSKPDMVLDALTHLAETAIPIPDTGSLADDLTEFVTATLQPRGQRSMLVGLMAQAVLDTTFAEAFRERFLFVRRDTFRGVLERAGARGELRPGLDLDLVIDVVFGVLWYRLLLQHVPLNGGDAAGFAEFLLRAITSA